MNWLRQRSRGSAGVALFAMALQIFCTFGHVHLADRSSLSAPAKSVTFAKAQSTDVVSLKSVAAAIDAVVPLPGSDGDGLCPLCLIGNFVASAIVSSAPALALPIVYARLDPPQSASVPASSNIQTSFWSRGPPTS